MSWWEDFEHVSSLNQEQYESWLQEQPLHKLYHVRVALDQMLDVGKFDAVLVLNTRNYVIQTIKQLEEI